eukprot:m.287319 g.287319  ORF g.287319 m.287319 type:complete len:353 (-) comp16362_c1_seq4:290-1348(-)
MADKPKNTPQIIKQVEFYFSDSNLMKPDKFLCDRIKENEDGYVDLGIIATFKRMTDLVPSKDVQEIAKALRSSSDDLLEISEDGTKVRRSQHRPLPKESQFNSRALYAKGFPLEGTTIESVEEYFTKKDYKVLQTRLRSYVDKEGAKKFKGSVFVELENGEAVDKCVGETHTLGENTLLVERKTDYHARKRKERAEKNEKHKQQKKKRKAEEMDGDAGEAVKEEPTEEEKIEYEKGCIMAFSGVGEGTSREDIKEVLGKHGEVQWVDFQRGDTNGEVRFAKPEAAVVKQKMEEAKDTIKGEVPKLRVLEGEEEEEFYKTMVAKKKEKINQHKRRKSGRGGRGRGRGRGKRRN